MKIGITTRYIYEDGIQKQFVNTQYLKFIEQFNLTPIILPIKNLKINELLEMCDMFLITGGDDLDSIWFNEELDPSVKNIEREMDILDKNVIEYCVKNKKPLFGICRGLQSINVFLGGSLYQDLEDKEHKNKESGQTALINDKGHFFKCLGKDEIEINSYHHQGIKVLAKDLIGSITSRGLIEGIEHKTLPIVAVQWHPEKLNDENSKKIFKEFISLSLKY